MVGRLVGCCGCVFFFFFGGVACMYEMCIIYMHSNIHSRTNLDGPVGVVRHAQARHGAALVDGDGPVRGGKHLPFDVLGGGWGLGHDRSDRGYGLGVYESPPTRACTKNKSTKQNHQPQPPTRHQPRPRPLLRPKHGQLGAREAAPIERQGQVAVEEGDGGVHRHELGPVAEGGLDLDLVQEGGDAGEDLFFFIILFCCIFDCWGVGLVNNWVGDWWAGVRVAGRRSMEPGGGNDEEGTIFIMYTYTYNLLVNPQPKKLHANIIYW